MSEDVSGAVVRLREDASGWRQVDGPELTAEEPFLAGLEDQEAEDLVQSNWALRRSSVDEFREYHGNAPSGDGEADEGPDSEDDSHDADAKPAVLDPSEYTVAELEDALATGDYDGGLGTIEAAEREGKDRDTALEAIDDRRDELSEAEE